MSEYSQRTQHMGITLNMREPGREVLAVLLGLLQVMPAWADGEMPLRLLRLAGLVVAGLITYFGMLLLLGFRLRDFARRAL